MTHTPNPATHGTTETIKGFPLRDGSYLIQGWRYLNDPHSRPRENVVVHALTLMLLAMLVPMLVWGNDVPVLKYKVERGTILNTDHFEHKNFEGKTLHPKVVRNTDKLVGKEATRPLRAGIPIYTSHVRVPPTISKNEVVTLLFEAPGLTLTGQGKALQDGAEGETVRVLNVASGKVVAGLIQDNGNVVVK